MSFQPQNNVIADQTAPLAAGSADYSEYQTILCNDPSCYGSECTEDQAEEYNERLVEMIEAKFPGIDVVPSISTSCTRGPAAETCEEVDRWIQDNWMKALVAVQPVEAVLLARINAALVEVEQKPVTTLEEAVSACVAVGVSEIQDDIYTGKVPATVASFAELHEYRDANCYGLLCSDKIWDPSFTSDYVFFVFANHVQAGIDAWVKARAAAPRCIYTKAAKKELAEQGKEAETLVATAPGLRAICFVPGELAGFDSVMRLPYDTLPDVDAVTFAALVGFFHLEGLL